MSQNQRAEALIQQHERSGRYIAVDEVKTFYVDSGAGPAVLCLHGVPTSSFLYRKVVPQLQLRGLRAIAIDLPGLGLSDRPQNFDYTFSSLGEFCNHFLDALNITEVHLLLHDIGTPVGLYAASQQPGRIRSITVLNSMLDLEHFEKPLPMRPFEKPVLGEAALAMLTPTTFPVLMKGAGVENENAITPDEMDAYVYLLKRQDEGKAFLKIMRHFEKSKAFTEACYTAWQNESYPVQLVWGDKDPFLTWDTKGKEFELARPGIPVTRVLAKHFLQEEAYETVAASVKALAE